MNQVKQIIERIKLSNITSRLLSGAFWSISSRVVGSGSTLIAFIVVARIIGTKQYGELGIVRSTILMFSTFAGAGIGLTASRYIALYRNIDKTKTNEVYLVSHYFSIGFGFIISILLFFFAPLIAERSLNAPYLVNEIRLGVLALFFIGLNSAQSGVLMGFERFKSITINTSIQGVIQFFLLIVGAYFWGIVGVIGGIALSSLLLWMLNYRAIHVNIPKKSLKGISIKKETIAILWKFSLPAAMSSILVIPVLWWCKTFVVQRYGFEQMANYDVAEQWNNFILFIPATLTGMIMPILTNTLMEGTMYQYQKLVTVNIWINAIISISLTLLVCLLAVFILKSYGKGFSDTTTFRILLISTIPNAVASVLGQVIASKEKMWMGFVLNLVWAIWLITFFLFFVVKMNYGTFGFALAMLIAYILHCIFSYAYMYFKVMNNNVISKKYEIYER